METASAYRRHLAGTNDLEVFTVKIQRHLAPTAAPVSWMDIFRALRAALTSKSSKSALKAQVKASFGVRHVFLVSSGKAALTVILQALAKLSARNEVIIPAYTCFSVASAVRRAGLRLVLCDIDPETFDLHSVRLKSLVGPNTLAIVAPHLLGQPADIAGIMCIAKETGAFVVEDAAQAMGGRDKGRWLGTQGDVGFFSLGRGKNVSAGSGGIIVTDSENVAEALGTIADGLPLQPVLNRILDFMVVAVTKMFLHPMLYWFPAGLSFLRLGETSYDETFPIYRMNAVQTGLLASWKSRLDDANRTRLQNSRLFLERLPSAIQVHKTGLSRESVALRLPLLMTTGEAKIALCRISHEDGLGISGLYPSTIAKIPELSSVLQSHDFPGAEIAANRLVTLPVHRYVTRRDVDRIAKAVHLSDPSGKSMNEKLAFLSGT